MILQSLEELESDLRNIESRRVYVLLGPERYQCLQALGLLKKKLLTPESIAFDYSEFSGTDATVAEITEAANIFPMLSKRRVVLVTEVDKLADSAQEALLKALEGFSPRGMLILLAEDLDHRKRFFKTLRECSCVAEFPRLKGVALERWAASFVHREGYRISAVAIKQIIELAGSDLQTLATEMEKLFLCADKQKTIPDSAVDDLVRGSRQHGIFELIETIGRHDRGGALRSLANLLETGEAPLRILAMIARHCRQMLIAKEGLLQGSSSREIASTAQIPPFMLDRFLTQARAADTITFQQMLIRLAEMDRQFKSSQGDARIFLEQLICGLV